MNIFTKSILYASSHTNELLAALQEHLLLVGLALIVAIGLGVPLGMLTARSRLGAVVILNAANGMRVLPSIAVLFLAIPFLGLSRLTAITALTVLALPPILLNTDTAFRQIPTFLREVAQGLGMTRGQQLWRVELPLALPLIFIGFKTASVEVMSSATLAAFIGGGGLGIYLTRGFALNDTSILLVGAIPVAMLTLLTEVLLNRWVRATGLGDS